MMLPKAEILQDYCTEEEYESYTKDIVAEILDKRNKNWIEQVGRLSKYHSCFYAVGAGHLAGEKGFVQLLKNKGFTVTALQ